MKIILGLGNPGLRFRYSRHNLGFLAVERLAQAKKIRINQKAFNCLLGKGTIENQKVFLAKPLTSMNLSAEAVLPLLKRKKITFRDLLIVCDDINLPLGKIRIRPKGSAGGHKGLHSIIKALGNEAFPRLIIGVGRPKAKAQGNKLTNFVLSYFNKKEIKTMNEALENAVSCCEVWIKQGIIPAMNKFNHNDTRTKHIGA